MEVFWPDMNPFDEDLEPAFVIPLVCSTATGQRSTLLLFPSE